MVLLFQLMITILNKKIKLAFNEMKIERNKIIAIYIVWCFSHLILFLTSTNFITSYNSKFFPFPIYKAFDEMSFAFSIYSQLELHSIYKILKDKGVTEDVLGSYETFSEKCKYPEKRVAIYETLLDPMFGYNEKSLGTIDEFCIRFTLGTYDNFLKIIKDKGKLINIYVLYTKEWENNYSAIASQFKNFPKKLDYNNFQQKILESIEQYGNNEYHTVYYFFPNGYGQYDYSEFIIYLLLPLVIGYFIKLWFAK